ncbi:DUF1304 domain-containing protein [Legionella feeleii]|uniref:Predicted membrane protein n=1 Tax=Legionella feeleii TaxID=453 RepID=A0A0W0TK74_9GAMM|nr:DUF1304 domain-containing protein [Legionella feeleii]KTC96028.1 hypothetical protein Lfee_2390 [Legionella feeleii]SPX60210.1 Predicted membrane protein [Legionella feeleii]STX37560.1 Predicted membrane protein [Legionella feeleii]
MLKLLADIGVVITAILHLWFFILEFFLWKKPLGRKIFRTQPEFAFQSAPLAANQGIYNGFLSAGLIWGLLSPEPIEAFHVKLFFLSCALIAGIAGGLLVHVRILFIQALPALLTLLFLLMQ